jgi:hypothetical protein
MTQEDRELILDEILFEMEPEDIVSIPEVRKALMKHFKDEIAQRSV